MGGEAVEDRWGRVLGPDVPAGLADKDPVRAAGGQAVGEDATGRPTADDHIVEFHRSPPASHRPRPGSALLA